MVESERMVSNRDAPPAKVGDNLIIVVSDSDIHRATRLHLERHGDVRTQPGFDPKARMAELEQLRRRAADQERQRDDVEKLNRLRDQIAEKLAKERK